MLSAEKFIAGMTFLKKNYIGWQFDTKDEMQVKLWYSAFKNLTDERFNELIKDYIATNDKPPMCIRDLTDILVDKIYSTAKIPPEKAFEIVRDIVSDCGGWDYGGKADIYKKLKSYPSSLVETVKEFEDTLRTMSFNDTYTIDRFRKAYAIRLRASAIREVDKRLGIAIAEPKLPSALGTSALPYET